MLIKNSGAVDYEDKLRKQSRLKNTVEQKGGEVLVLRKREIENYYSPRIVKENFVGERIRGR
mgnify:CR=1 FL=1